ncbi:MAG: response regulator transcription factor [Chitinophagaceae bacterium]|nr:response regulator transcription factor [Chitinophagaceae bacterium]
MIRCILVDDDSRNNFILEKLIEQFCTDVQVLGAATSAASAVQLIKQHQPDLIFLDVEMPGKNAFDLLEDLRPVNFQVVFVTAFDKYAVRAFRVGALDYLLKPVSIDDLKNAVKRVEERQQHSSSKNQVESYLEALGKSDLTQRIVLPVKDGYAQYELDSILYCKAKGAYTTFHFTDGHKILITGTLKSFEEVLPESIFVRIHHSSIVNLQHVTSYTRGRGGYVTIKDGSQLDVAQRKREEFLSRFQGR